MVRRQKKIGIEFTETMLGYFAEDEEDFQKGFEKGEKQDSNLSFDVTISIDDVSEFTRLSGRKAVLEGTVSSKRFGEKIEIRNGEFNLFRPSRTTGKREMTYSFGFTGDDGADYFLYGYKVIYDNPGVDVSDDMTTLFTRVYRGNSRDGLPFGSGILQFKMRDLPSMLASFKVINADSLVTRIKTIQRFYSFCYGEIRDTYLDKLSPIYYTRYENLILNGKVVSGDEDPRDFFFFSGVHDKDFPWGDGELFWDMGLIVRNGDDGWDRFILTDRIFENLTLDVEKGAYQYEGEIYQIVEGHQASFSHLKKPTLPDHLRELHARINIKFSSQEFQTVDLPFPLASNYKKRIPKQFMEDMEELADQLGALGVHLTPYSVSVTKGEITILDDSKSKKYEIQTDKTFGEAEKATFNNIKEPTLDYDYTCALNPETKHVYVSTRSGALQKSRKFYPVDGLEEYIGKIIGQRAALDLEIQNDTSRILPDNEQMQFDAVDENLLQINNDHYPTAVFQRRVASFKDKASGKVFYALIEDMDTLNLSNIESDKVVKVAAVKDSDKFRALDAVLEATGFFEKLDEACELSQKDKESFAIIVKPNFMFTYNKKDVSTYTDPALVDHLVDRIYEKGYRNLAVAEARSSYGTFYKNREVKTLAEYIGLSGKNYRIIDLSEELIEHDYSGTLGKHQVNREWANADFRISFAKSKTHSYAYYTLTIKNIYGALPSENKFKEYHCDRDIFTTTVEYIRNFPIHFGLIDASVSADGPFGIFADKKPNPTDTIIGGEDIVAVDWIGSYKMGLDPMDSPYMEKAVEQFGKPEIELIGDRELYPNWRNVPDVVSLISFGLDMNFYFGNLFYSVFSYMDPYFEYKDKRLNRRLIRVLSHPMKTHFYQTVESGKFDLDFIRLNYRLFRDFEKAAHVRGRSYRLLVGGLAGAGILGIISRIFRRRSRK